MEAGEAGAFELKVDFKKLLKDNLSSETSHLPTWQRVFEGKHHNSYGSITYAVGKLTDKFIDEYLRVNAEACEAKAMSAPQ